MIKISFCFSVRHDRIVWSLNVAFLKLMLLISPRFLITFRNFFRFSSFPITLMVILFFVKMHGVSQIMSRLNFWVRSLNFFRIFTLENIMYLFPSCFKTVSISMSSGISRSSILYPSFIVRAAMPILIPCSKSIFISSMSSIVSVLSNKKFSMSRNFCFTFRSIISFLIFVRIY